MNLRSTLASQERSIVHKTMMRLEMNERNAVSKGDANEWRKNPNSLE